MLASLAAQSAAIPEQDDGGHLEGSGPGAHWVVPTQFERSPHVFEKILKDDKEGFQVTTDDGLHTVIRTEIATVIPLPQVPGQIAPMELRLLKKTIVQIDFVDGQLRIHNFHDTKKNAVMVAFVGTDQASHIPLGDTGIFDITGARHEFAKPLLIKVSDKRTMDLYIKDVAILDSMGAYRA